jgi:hypothetical protein
MTDLNPMVPGDVPYPQYSSITSMEILPTTIVIKGHMYTTDSSGLLDNIDSGGSDAQLPNGVFQAMADGNPAGATAGDTVQVLGPRSRIIMGVLATNIGIGEIVNLQADSDKAIVGGARYGDSFFGRVFEIYTRNADSTRKTATDTVDDLIVVEMIGI